MFNKVYRFLGVIIKGFFNFGICIYNVYMYFKGLFKEGILLFSICMLVLE